MATTCPPRFSNLCRPFLLVLGLMFLLGVWPAKSRAQITLDGSLGPAGALPGPQYVIPATVGKIRGHNLFHSFGQFHLSAGDSATFTGPATITNVLSRVTGGFPSNIDGLVRSDIAGANLYLFNPYGVWFGANARLEVSGSFHVSTADYLRLADGTRFSVPPGAANTLSIAAPEAFGFLGPKPAYLFVQRSALQVPEGKTLSVIGGNLAITGNAALTKRGAGIPTLGAPGGRVHLVSVASAGEVGVSPSGVGSSLAKFASLGQINVWQDAWLSVDGERAGTVVIRGGKLLVDNAMVSATNRGSQDGARMGVDIAVRDNITGKAASITTITEASGHGGAVRITAGHVEMTQAMLLSTQTALGSTGPGGNLTIIADTATISDVTTIGTITQGTGPGGNVRVAVKGALL